jgi:hypothetical protein
MSCFDQDPSEHANISGADFAAMCDEMSKLKFIAKELADAIRPFSNPKKTMYGARIIEECNYPIAAKALAKWDEFEGRP